MPNLPHRHHYIPQFYLNWWAGDDGCMERYTKPLPSKVEVKRLPAKAIGWWNDLYRSPESHPKLEQHLELNFFSRLDYRTSQVLRKLNSLEVPQLSREEISVWSTFLMSLLHRTPEGLEAMKGAGKRILDATLPEVRDRFQELRGEDDPKTFEEYEASLTAEDRERSLLRVLPSIVSNPRIGSFLNELNWQYVEPPEDCPSFLLSDDPLGRTNGLKKLDGHLAIPISPRRLLIGAYQPALLRKLLSMNPRELVTNMNKWVVESARHFVVAVDRSQTRFIKNRFGTNLKKALGRSIG